MQLASHRGAASRRAIVRAGAWSVPAISLAAAQQSLSDQDRPSYRYLQPVSASGSEVAVPISDGVHVTTTVADVSEGQRST